MPKLICHHFSSRRNRFCTFRWLRTFVCPLLRLFLGLESVMVDSGFIDGYETAPNFFRIATKLFQKVANTSLSFCSDESNHDIQRAEYLFIRHSWVKILLTTTLIQFDNGGFFQSCLQDSRRFWTSTAEFSICTHTTTLKLGNLLFKHWKRRSWL